MGGSTDLIIFRGHRGSIWSMVSKGHRLFSAGGDKVIKVWNMENVRLARCTEVLEGHTNDVSQGLVIYKRHHNLVLHFLREVAGMCDIQFICLFT